MKTSHEHEMVGMYGGSYKRYDNSVLIYITETLDGEETKVSAVFDAKTALHMYNCLHNALIDAKVLRRRKKRC